MRNLKNILLIALLTFKFSQAQNNSLNFKISSDLDQVPNYEKIKTINSPNSKLDIYFYKNNFNFFFGLPKSLIEPKLKNQEIIKWANESAPKELNKNWKESFKYDSEGKLIEYKYSSCVICSQRIWGYKLIYNENKDITEQRIYNLNQKSEFQEEMLQSKVKLIYDKNRNLTQVVEYVERGIQKLVKLIE